MTYTEHRIQVARTARWGLIGDCSESTREVWFVLHGYAQLAADFAGSARWPSVAGLAFVFPEALQRFYAADPAHPGRNRTAPVVASWMTREARLDDIADNHAYLDALWAHIRTLAPSARLTVLGFSQGGATAARWCAERARHDPALRRLVLWGSAFPDDLDLGESSSLRRMAIVFAFGDRDQWVTSKLVEAHRARFAAAGFPARMVEYAGGHRLDDETLRQLAADHHALEGDADVVSPLP